MKKLLIISVLAILVGCGEEKPKYNAPHKFKSGDIVCNKLTQERYILIGYCDYCSDGTEVAKLKDMKHRALYLKEFELCKCDSIQHDSY